MRAAFTPIAPLITVATTVLVAVTTSLGAAPASAATLPGLQSPPARPMVEPVRDDPVLQITEIVPNSVNVAGQDAFEFIEVRNASDQSYVWDHAEVRYLYPLVDLVTLAHVAWPSAGSGSHSTGVGPAADSPVLEPGDVLVLWVRTGYHPHLTAADFNAAYGTDLTLGVDLWEISGAGLANNALRGVEIVTRSGISLSRAYYNQDGTASLGAGDAVHYGPTTEPHAPQPMLHTSTATPGSVSAAQVGATISAAAAGTPPIILDEPRGSFLAGRELTIDAFVHDDAQVRDVTLDLWSDLDPEPVTHRLQVDHTGMYGLTLSAADTVGRSAFHYRFHATDGHHRISGETRTVERSAEPKPVRMRAIDTSPPAYNVATAPASPLPVTVRPELKNGQAVTGDVLLLAGFDGPDAQVSVNGDVLQTAPALEHEPLLAFEATVTDAYFRNGVTMNGDLLSVFDQGFYGEVRTVVVPVPVDELAPDVPVTLSVVSGTKAATGPDPEEGNDDFLIANLRLVLPDGRTLRPAQILDAQQWITVGDGAGAVDQVDATFSIPADAFSAVSAIWDTTAIADGDHQVQVASGGAVASARVRVDNTAPRITTSIVDGQTVRGDTVLDAAATDAGAVTRLTATLDGQTVRLPLEMSSLTWPAGTHQVAVTAVDDLGNSSTTRLDVTIPHETPTVTPVSTLSTGATGSVAALVDDGEDDALQVDFAHGRALVLGQQVAISTGTTSDARSTERGDAQPVTRIDALATPDGRTTPLSSARRLPYVLIEAEVDGSAGNEVRLRWDGIVEAHAKVTLQVLDPTADAWVEVDRYVTNTDGAASEEEVALDATVPAARFADDGVVTAVVQHSQGYAGADLSSRTDLEEPHHPDDLARGSYDATIAWQSDTQYYHAYQDIYDLQLAMQAYLVTVAEDINLQYVVHTGDIVDWSEQPEQWHRADAAYRILDEADIPYSVLAGNHDVNQQTHDYTEFSRWFGASRFEHRPWYGASHQDNRGHYDLVTIAGVDFLFVSMGWGAADEQIDWMNSVLAEYPERIAVLSLHEYILTTGGLGILPQRIFDEVVSTNPSVRMVLSGHYHDAFTRIDHLDDDGDGVPERTVTSMLFDYQDLPHGGEGFLRLLHLDNVSQTLRVRTYSDSLRTYNAVHPALPAADQDFEIPYAHLGITVHDKVLDTDAVRVDILTDDVFAHAQQVPAGSAVPAVIPEGAQGWYVRVTDPHGATAVTEIQVPSVNTTVALVTPRPAIAR